MQWDWAYIQTTPITSATEIWIIFPACQQWGFPGFVGEVLERFEVFCSPLQPVLWMHFRAKKRNVNCTPHYTVYTSYKICTQYCSIMMTSGTWHWKQNNLEISHGSKPDYAGYCALITVVEAHDFALKIQVARWNLFHFHLFQLRLACADSGNDNTSSQVNEENLWTSQVGIC